MCIGWLGYFSLFLNLFKKALIEEQIKFIGDLFDRLIRRVKFITFLRYVGGTFGLGEELFSIFKLRILKLRRIVGYERRLDGSWNSRFERKWH